MELLITYIIFLLIPPLLILLLFLFWRDCIHWRKYLALYIIFWGVLAYSYAPQPDSGDLVRYFERLYFYNQYSIIDAIRYFPYRELGENVLTWIAAKFNMPGLLPCMAALTVYGVASYITCDYAENHGKSEIIRWILLFQIIIIPFNSVVNNVFNVTAFAIVLLAIYRDLVKNKKNILTGFLYVLACLIHQAALVLIVIRFLAIPAKKLRYAAIAIVAFVPGLINLSYNNRILFSNIPIIYSLINRAYYYLSEVNDSEFALRVQSDLWYGVFFVVCMGFAVLIIFALLRVLKGHSYSISQLARNEKTFLAFLLLSGLLTVSCVVFSMPHYWRFILVGQMAVGPIITLYDNDRLLFEWKCAFFTFSMLQLAIQLFRLVKSAVIISDWMINFILSSPITIIIKMIFAVIMF